MLNGRRVTVFGLGKTGLACARFLSNQGARVLVTDRRSPSEHAPNLPLLAQWGCQWELGEHGERALSGAELLLLSPGVSLDNDIVKEGIGRGIPLMGEIELAYRFCPAPIVAVTGTNGKGTTTRLIAAILREKGLPVHVAGNIGTPLVEGLHLIGPDSLVVLEVSSFQLETISSFRPRVAVLLNISEDHLDRHPDFETYRKMKERLFEYQEPSDCAVLNADDPAVAPVFSKVRCPCLPFSQKKSLEEGAFFEGETWATSLRGEKVTYGARARASLSGRHNWENILAATLASVVLGARPDDVQRALENFNLEHHRIEYVATIRGVTFYDDSKGTNPSATQAALESFSSPVILIAGGKNKKLDFTHLGSVIASRAKCLLLLGESADELEHAARKGGMRAIERVADFREAVKRAGEMASPADVVLFSPACASFDMFRNAEERGEVFQAEVRRLASEIQIS
ncbi:MAG: UDP-N-acetylmuramoyl-L-alanine--D-glutamate ligase [Armatimonadetes bacterium]|nr:UDP-N-acetylmuramoyl-L-alanine--D-glutamate ligase [Armatimonadota bacterium]